MEISEKFVKKNLLPGDVIGRQTKDFVKKSERTTIIGGGLRVLNQEIVVTKAGLLTRHDVIIGQNNSRTITVYQVENKLQSIYHPKRGEAVIGLVSRTSREFLILDIGGTSDALLNKMAFDGANKRNYPRLYQGDVVYAKVVSTSRVTDCELSCITPKSLRGNRRFYWSDGKSLYGELKGGYVFTVDRGTALWLLQDECPLLKVLGESIAFDIVVGMNGKVWCEGESPKETFLVIHSVWKCRNLVKEEEMKDTIKLLWKELNRPKKKKGKKEKEEMDENDDDDDSKMVQ